MNPTLAAMAHVTRHKLSASLHPSQLRATVLVASQLLPLLQHRQQELVRIIAHLESMQRQPNLGAHSVAAATTWQRLVREPESLLFLLRSGCCSGARPLTSGSRGRQLLRQNPQEKRRSSSAKKGIRLDWHAYHAGTGCFTEAYSVLGEVLVETGADCKAARS